MNQREPAPYGPGGSIPPDPADGDVPRAPADPDDPQADVDEPLNPA